VILDDAAMPPVPLTRDQQGMRAGLVSRAIADVIDAIVVTLVLVVGYFSFSAILFVIRPRTFSFPTPGRYWALLIAGVVVIAYLTFGWFVTGRTPGKQLAGLRVVTGLGLPLSFPGALVRATLYVLFPIGFLWSAFSSKNASVQDLLLRTSVIYDWRNHVVEQGSMGSPDATIRP
jgi:uncharacterized RDD family membrane protein YckC